MPEKNPFTICSMYVLNYVNKIENKTQNETTFENKMNQKNASRS